MMRVNGPFSIGLLEAISLLAWTLAVLACLISIERQNRVLGRHPAGECGGRSDARPAPAIATPKPPSRAGS